MAMSGDALKKLACDVIDQAAADLYDVSKRIWERPELKFEEHFASELLANFLESRGFNVHRKYVMETGFRAEYGTDESRPLVAVMCEYDALPDIGHACGHNLIAEVGVGAALGIIAALKAAEASGNPLGRVAVFGTPGEEGGGGKVEFLRHGAFQNPPVACAMMAHPWTVDVARPEGFHCRLVVKVTYLGHASHASCAPWQGINALDAAVMAYTFISALRQQLKPSWRIHGVITKGGVRPNIIPEVCELDYALRAPTTEELATLKQKATACFQAAALGTGCQMELRWADHIYESVINNATAASLYESNARSLGLTFDGETSTRAPPPVGSTDMGNVSHVVPSIHPVFHIGGYAANHTHDFKALAGSAGAQPFTLRQAKLLTMTAIDVFTQPDLVAKMAAELKQDLEKQA